MKKTYTATMIVVFVVFGTNGLQAQTSPTELNQVELMKQFTGNMVHG